MTTTNLPATPPTDPVDPRGAAVWLVDGPDGCYGVYATRELAEAHIAAMSDPTEFTVEHDIVRTELMPGLEPRDAA